MIHPSHLRTASHHSHNHFTSRLLPLEVVLILSCMTRLDMENLLNPFPILRILSIHNNKGRRKRRKMIKRTRKRKMIKLRFVGKQQNLNYFFLSVILSHSSLLKTLESINNSVVVLDNHTHLPYLVLRSMVNWRHTPRPTGTTDTSTD